MTCTLFYSSALVVKLQSVRWLCVAEIFAASTAQEPRGKKSNCGQIRVIDPPTPTTRLFPPTEQVANMAKVRLKARSLIYIGRSRFNPNSLRLNELCRKLQISQTWSRYLLPSPDTLSLPLPHTSKSLRDLLDLFFSSPLLAETR